MHRLGPHFELNVQAQTTALNADRSVVLEPRRTTPTAQASARVRTSSRTSSEAHGAHPGTALRPAANGRSPPLRGAADRPRVGTRSFEPPAQQWCHEEQQSSRELVAGEIGKIAARGQNPGVFRAPAG